MRISGRNKFENTR